jgi:hypothetical protein
MNDKNEPQRGLEKIYHFFLTGEAPSNQTPGTSGNNSFLNGEARLLKSTIQQLDDEYSLLKNTVAQLYVLRESCKGNYHNTQKSYEDILWFKGAEAILQDAIVNLIKTLRFLDTNNNQGAALDNKNYGHD